jgi:uncharacterized protein YcsI (UPF0317 family)
MGCKMQNIQSPSELRQLIRIRKWTTPANGNAKGYLRAK